MQVSIRNANNSDAAAIAGLVRELARSIGEDSPLTEDFVATYLAFASNTILVAERQDGIFGLLSYSLRPNLYHSGEVCQIEELVVTEKVRNQGIGDLLLKELLYRIIKTRCAEISVSTLPDNHKAIEFYRKHGFKEEGVLLEIHPVKKEQ